MQWIWPVASNGNTTPLAPQFNSLSLVLSVYFIHLTPCAAHQSLQPPQGHPRTGWSGSSIACIMSHGPWAVLWFWECLCWELSLWLSSLCFTDAAAPRKRPRRRRRSKRMGCSRMEMTSIYRMLTWWKKCQNFPRPLLGHSVQFGLAVFHCYLPKPL